MSPFRSYQQLFHMAGPAYVVVAFLGRMPLAMSQLGTLLLVAESTDSYAAGGASAGALALANAVGCPDRRIAGRLLGSTARRAGTVAQRRARSAHASSAWLRETSRGRGLPLLLP